MGFLDKFRHTAKQPSPEGYFRTLSGYTPVFSSYNGGVYEMLLTRAAVHQIATQFSKLSPEVSNGNESIRAIFERKPNQYQTPLQFLYRTATILMCDTTAFVVPLLSQNGKLQGVFTPKPSQVSAVDVHGELFYKFNFSGQEVIVEGSRCGTVTQYQYEDDLFGGGNAPLNDTLQLYHAQNNGLMTRIKDSAAIRFIGKLSTQTSPDDITKKRDKFYTENLSSANNTGLMLYDMSFSDIKQVEQQGFTIDAEQQKEIDENVYSYFGISKKIIQNDFDEDEWNAFYEGKIEPIAMQVSQVLTNMAFTDTQQRRGSKIMLTSNSLQYSSNRTKLSVVINMTDRGLMTGDQAMDIFNMPHFPGGDKRVIRGEYILADNIAGNTISNAKAALEQTKLNDEKDEEDLADADKN